MTIQNLVQGLQRFHDLSLDGMAAGLDTDAERITDAMQATSAHGDQTGATRANYNARRVGRGQTGAAAHAASVAAVEGLNPGHAASAPVSVEGIGVIIDSATDYQEKLETENAGDRAVLGPTITAESLALTAAAAAGSKKALGG